MRTVAFQGELGAYSEEAIQQVLGAGATPHPCREFHEVGEAVESGVAEFGLLPVENTLAGSVVPSFDVLASSELAVLGEVVIPIHHCVLGLPTARLEGLSRILSHPVALAQCTRFLRASGVEAVAVYDTAGAARQVAAAGDPAVGAIAGRAAAGLYGLRVLAHDVEDRPDNQTRFLLVARPGTALPPEIRSGSAEKVLLIVETENRPGSLLRVLEPLAEHGLNLSHIQSRPGEQPWTYRFFLEVESGSAGAPLQAAIAAVEGVSLRVRVLGGFPRLGTGPGTATDGAA